MKTLRFKGESIAYANTTGSPILSGAVVAVGAMIGIAVKDIADGETGSLAVEGVHELAKNTTLAINQGDMLYFDVADNELNKTSTDNTPAGLAWSDQGSADATVLVKLNAR